MDSLPTHAVVPVTVSPLAALKRVFKQSAHALVLSALVSPALADQPGITVLHHFNGSTEGRPGRGQHFPDGEGGYIGFTSESVYMLSQNVYSIYTNASAPANAYRVASDGTVTVFGDGDSVLYPGAAIGTGIAKDGEGNFYGTTAFNSTGDYGTIFKMTPEGNFEILKSFGHQGSVGMHPTGGLVLASDGCFYGISHELAFGAGFTDTIVFKYDPEGSGSLTKLGDVASVEGNIIIAGAPLVEGPDGQLYGVLVNGGTAGKGSVFKISRADGAVTVLHEFDGEPESDPWGGLIVGSDGNFWGTYYGFYNPGAHEYNFGGVFKITTTGDFTTYPYNASQGAFPSGTLVQGPDGNFYGTTNRTGDSPDNGTLFKMTPSGDYTFLYKFGHEQETGKWPSGHPILTPDNKMMGVTNTGGSNYGGTLWTFDLTSFLNAPSDILVKNHAGSEVATGSTYAFGSIPVGTPVTRTFTIRNDGISALNITSVSVTGGNSSEFAVNTTGMDSSLGGTEETTFTVTATAGAASARATTLRIISDDEDEATFSIPLTATGIPAAPIQFAAATYSTKLATSGNTIVKVQLKRTTNAVAQSVTIHTDDGATTTEYPPYQAAVAGTDYVDLAGTKTTVTIPAGKSFVDVPITLKLRTGAQPNRYLTATISEPTNGATLGTISTTRINIIGRDTTAPTLAITSPTPNEVINGTGAGGVTVTGTVSDANGIVSLTMKDDFGTYNVPLGTPDGSGVISFSHVITPSLGADSVEITAKNLFGSSTKVTRNFTFQGGVGLSIARVVPSSHTTKRDSVGTVSVKATPVPASALLPTTANSNPKTCKVLQGAVVTVTATAKSGFVFSHWENTPAGATEANNVLTFTMPGTATGLTAHFVTIPFNAPTSFGSTFAGLISPASGTPDSAAAYGFFTGSLTGANGSFTGEVCVGGEKETVVGVFDGDGSFTFRDGSVRSSTMVVGDRTVTLNYDPVAKQTISVLVTHASGNSEGTAQRCYYSTSRKVPAAMRIGTSTQGYYTIALPTKAQTPAIDLSTYPQGDGYLTLTLTDLGAVSFGGRLADGTNISGATHMTSANSCVLYSQFATSGATPATVNSVFFGTLVFDPAQPNSDVSATDLTWMRPATNAVAYTAGWPSGIKLDALGAKYVKTTLPQAGLGLGASSPTGNAEIAFSDGKLAGSITHLGFNVVGKTATLLPGSSGYSVNFSDTTGTMSGNFTPTWGTASTRTNYYGILIQKGASKGGYGYFISNISADTDPESGGVTLSAP